MTIAPDKHIIRETLALDRGKPVMVQLFPHSLRVWVKGKRESVVVPYDAILDLGRKLAFERRRGI